MSHDNEAKTFRFVLPLADIPDGFEITKITGNKKYVVRREVVLHDSDQKLVAEKGAAILIDASGNMSLVSETKDVILEIGPEFATRLIEEGTLRI